jgi:group II intron reverse transcriptase/maturase
VKRSYVPKEDGKQRAIGVPTLEDKIVQRATTEVLNAVYEADFLGMSYGFRPGRNPHDALDALCVAISSRDVNWVLDADIRGFFDTISHEWLLKFVEHRIADKRVLRHIKKWLNAGVMEGTDWVRVTEGTPQGGSISPLLANIYLHYVFDLWFKRWRRKQASGDAIAVRYCDDFVVGFEHREEAEHFLEELKQRLGQFGLALHPEKTRLIEFGRRAIEDRQRRGEGRPDTLNFLGFTHVCRKTRNDSFTIARQTMQKRLRRKVKEITEDLRNRMHEPIPVVGKWLSGVLKGHYQYYGVPWNTYAMSAFRSAVVRLWHRTLNRRGQKRSCTWKRMARLAKRWLPYPRVVHPYPSQRFRVRLKARAR